MHHRLSEMTLESLFASGCVLTELQLDNYGEKHKLMELLSFADGRIIYQDQPDPTKSTTIINPLPQYHAYQNGVFDVSPIYMTLFDKNYLFYYYGIYGRFDDKELIGLSNYLLDFMGSDKRIYDIKGFGLGLYGAFDDHKAKELGFDLTITDDILIYTPYDLVDVHHDEAFRHILDNASDFDVPETGSLSSKDASDWLVAQKGRILAWTFYQVPAGLSAWQEYPILDKFRLIFNLYIALARNAIADSRVVDDKYKNYPLANETLFKELIQQLLPNNASDAKIVEFFLDKEWLMVWVLHKKENDELKRVLLSGSA